MADATKGLINYRSLLPVLLYKSNNNTESENIHQKLTKLTQIIHMHMHILKMLLESDGTANKNSFVILTKHHFVLVTPFM